MCAQFQLCPMFITNKQLTKEISILATKILDYKLLQISAQNKTKQQKCENSGQQSLAKCTTAPKQMQQKQRGIIICHTPEVNALTEKFRKQSKEVLSRTTKGISKQIVEIIPEITQWLSKDTSKKLAELHKIINK